MARKDMYNLQQWLKLAQQSGYNAHQLSKGLQVSRRQLQRYTNELFGRSPQDWLDEQRLTMAGNMLKECRSVKKVAAHLGFKQVSHFSREFKQHYGLNPTAFLARNDRQVLNKEVNRH